MRQGLREEAATNGFTVPRMSYYQSLLQRSPSNYWQMLLHYWRVVHHRLLLVAVFKRFPFEVRMHSEVRPPVLLRLEQSEDSKAGLL